MRIGSPENVNSSARLSKPVGNKSASRRDCPARPRGYGPAAGPRDRHTSARSRHPDRWRSTPFCAASCSAFERVSSHFPNSFSQFARPLPSARRRDGRPRIRWRVRNGLPGHNGVAQQRFIGLGVQAAHARVFRRLLNQPQVAPAGFLVEQQQADVHLFVAHQIGVVAQDAIGESSFRVLV
jgi:hypothetical protein